VFIIIIYGYSILIIVTDRYDGKRGWFPSNYVEIIDEPPPIQQQLELEQVNNRKTKSRLNKLTIKIKSHGIHLHQYDLDKGLITTQWNKNKKINSVLVYMLPII
jgi:hypothetical protein